MKNRTTYKKDTRDTILRTGLSLFNDHGVETIGIREIARTLGLSPGNVSYYFPKKEDLIIELSKHLSAKNSIHFNIHPDLTFSQFLEKFDSIAKNQYEYRFLLISMTHLLTNFPDLAKKYQVTQEQRTEDISKIITTLKYNGYIKKTISKSDQEVLQMSLRMLGKFWMVDWYGSLKRPSLRVRLQLNRELYIFLFKPYLTLKGINDAKL